MSTLNVLGRFIISLQNIGQLLCNTGIIDAVDVVFLEEIHHAVQLAEVDHLELVGTVGRLSVGMAMEAADDYAQAAGAGARRVHQSG